MSTSDDETYTANIEINAESWFAVSTSNTTASWDDFNTNHRYTVNTNDALTSGTYNLAKNGDKSNSLTTGKWTISIVKSTMAMTVTRTGNAGDATISSVSLAGSFNSWDKSNTLESNGDNTWTTTLDLEDSFADPTFKLVINGDTWIGYSALTITAPTGWVSEAESDGNCKLSNTTTGYQTYTITASWTPSSDASAGWTLTVAGADERTFYLIYSTDNEDTWNVGDALTGDATLSISKAFVANELFAIAANAAITNNAVSDWTAVVRPTADGTRFDLYTCHYSSTTQTGTNDASAPIWRAIDAGTYTINFTPASAAYTVDAVSSVTISDAGWATYSTGYAGSGYGYTITGADKVYYVSATANGYATLTEIASSTIIPDGTGVIVKGSDAFTVTTTSSTPATIEGNLLTGTTVHTYNFYYTSDENKYEGYILAKPEGKDVGFYLSQSGTLATHKAFIPSTKVAGANFLGFTFDDENTGISSVSANSKGSEIYNLAGQRQSQLQKGLNIVNGKKVLVK